MSLIGWLVARMYRGETAGLIELPFETGIGLRQYHILLERGRKIPRIGLAVLADACRLH